MKKTIMTAMISVFVVLILSGFVLAGSVSGNTEEKNVPDVSEGNAYTGTWELSYKNDRSGLDKVFPDIYAFGSELTVRPDGKIYWHIGAAGAAGTYEVFDGQLALTVSDIMEYDEYRMAVTKNDDGELVMKYKSVPLVWTYISDG